MKKRTSYTVDTIFVLVLFAVFATTVLFVLMSGAGVYKNTQMVMQERYEERTCLSYITAKVNHYDQNDCIYITEFEGIPSLAINENVEGTNFTTYIYCYDGYVKELMFQSGLEFDPSAGENIIEAKSLVFEKEGNLITVKCTGTKGSSASVSLNVAGGLEGGV